MKQDSLYIVMPAYNEEANIAAVIEEWYPVVEKTGGDSRLVIVNDGSKDKTYQIMRSLRDRYPRLLTINKKNEGHGPTVLRAYKKAIDAGADYIFQTDSDGQTIPEEFWSFWEQREKCGLLIGYRKGRQDGVSRVFVTRVLRLVLLLVFHVWVKDANTPFRLMRGEELEGVLKKIPEQFFLPNVLMTVIYHKNKLGVTYIPITFRPRQGGVNSLNLKRIFRIGKQAVGDFWGLRKRI